MGRIAERERLNAMFSTYRRHRIVFGKKNFFLLKLMKVEDELRGRDGRSRERERRDGERNYRRAVR